MRYCNEIYRIYFSCKVTSGIVFQTSPFTTLFRVFMWDYTLHTERRAKTVNIPTSYSWGPIIKSRPGYRLSWQRIFVVFLSTFRQMPGECRNCFLPHNFQFIIHLSYFRSTLYILTYWRSVVKETAATTTVTIDTTTTNTIDTTTTATSTTTTTWETLEQNWVQLAGHGPHPARDHL
jgi:hypothetical protein